MDEEKQEMVLLDRGMNKDECQAKCTSPSIPLREKLFFRMIYETTIRPREVLEARIELWNRNTGRSPSPRPGASTTAGQGATSRAHSRP